MRSRKRTWFLVRIAVYITAIAALYLYRGGVPWRQLVNKLGASTRPTGTLTVAGCDLAPRLADRLLLAYGRDYPDLGIVRRGGGTNQALEDLLGGAADVALLYRRPSPQEQAYFRAADGDTAIVVPVAVGAGLLLIQAGAATPAPDPAQLRELLEGRRPQWCDRLYTTDPNEGLWEAVRAGLDLSGPERPEGSPVVFLADAAAVTDAVRADDGAWGLVGSLSLEGDALAGPPTDLAYLALRAAADSAAAAPTRENLASGAYPLHHMLYAASRAGGSIEGAKFMTYLASPRGLRQVGRAGEVPARLVARTIQLSRDPVNK